MGDRTTVTLDILNTQVALAKTMQHFDGFAEEYPGENGNVLTSFIFNEVNYGELYFLEDLENLGIAYDSRWDAGCEYSAGIKHARFTAEGELQLAEVYDTGVNPDIDHCIKLIDDYPALRQYLINHKAQTTPLPWDNQEEYGKIYRTKKLIQGN